MKLARLQADPASTSAVEPREARIEVAGGTVQLHYYPAPPGSADTDLLELLGRQIVGWDVTDEHGAPVPLNADILNSLLPATKAAFRDAILGKKPAQQARPEPRREAKAEPVAVTGSFGDNSPIEKKQEAKHD